MEKTHPLPDPRVQLHPQLQHGVLTLRTILWEKGTFALDLEYGLLQAKDNYKTLDARGYMKQFKARIQEAFELASQVEQHEKDRSKRRYDAKAKALTILEGDLVLMRNFRRSKIDCKWQEDPYVVLKRVSPQVYKIQLQKDPTVVYTINRNKLFPAALLRKRWESTREGPQPGTVKILKRKSLEVAGEGEQEQATHPENETGMMTRSKTKELKNFQAGIKALQTLYPVEQLAAAVETAPETQEEVD